MSNAVVAGQLLTAEATNYYYISACDYNMRVTSVSINLFLPGNTLQQQQPVSNLHLFLSLLHKGCTSRELKSIFFMSPNFGSRCFWTP